VKLYAEQLHPNYLRNIGRCYLNLAQPDKAISSFREYLRKARNLATGEREEIEGYIREMEELKRQTGGHRAAGDARPAAHIRLTPSPPTSTSTSTSPLQLTAPPTDTVAETPPVYKRWWFWTAVGAAVVGGTLAVVLATRGKQGPSLRSGPDMQVNRSNLNALVLALLAAACSSEVRPLVPVDIAAGGVSGIKSVEVIATDLGGMLIKQQRFDWTAAANSPLLVGLYLTRGLLRRCPRARAGLR
jgi:hypothetical protein